MALRQVCSDGAAVCASLDFSENSVAIRIGDLDGSAADSCSGRVLHDSPDVAGDLLGGKETSSQCNHHNQRRQHSELHKSSWLPEMLPEACSRHLLLRVFSRFTLSCFVPVVSNGSPVGNGRLDRST